MTKVKSKLIVPTIIASILATTPVETLAEPSYRISKVDPTSSQNDSSVDNCFHEVNIEGEVKRLYNPANVFFTVDPKTEKVEVYLQTKKENTNFKPNYSLDNPRYLDYLESETEATYTIFDFHSKKLITTCEGEKQEDFLNVIIVEGEKLNNLDYNFGGVLSDEDISHVINTLAPRAIAVEKQGHYNIRDCFQTIIKDGKVTNSYSTDNLCLTIDQTGKTTCYLQKKEKKTILTPYYIVDTECIDYVQSEQKTKCTIFDINGTNKIGTCEDGCQQELFPGQVVVDWEDLSSYGYDLTEISSAELAELTAILPQVIVVDRADEFSKPPYQKVK